nr:hypothetical protein [Tanacetum cinerariifolium]
MAFCILDHHYQWKVMSSGLKKNAPPAFQKAMITIFESILANTLVYIDDILLFSPDEQSHTKLLLKFYSLVTKYGIMLSEKKMEVGVTTIQFLGMEITDGKYQPQPHWTSRQTEIVKVIKSLAEKMPPLKIHASSEKRILQTDASDECWGAVLLVQDNNNKRHVCGYKSGTFKAYEKHYYSTFKEILTVKRGIKKFQFHLIGHEFQVEMDMSSFPRMPQFKGKMLPHAQLLRLSLSSKGLKIRGKLPKDASRFQKHTPYFLSTVFSVASHEEEGSSSNTTPTIPVFDLPEEIVKTNGDLTFEKRAKLCYKTFLTILLKNHGLCIKCLRPRYFLPPKVVNDDGSIVYHAQYCFIHDWYKVNPSSRRCERKLQTLYTDTRSLMARENGVDPNKIPYYVMWNISIWNKDHLDAYKWIEANGQWIYDNFDHCEVETSDDDDDARSLWSLDDDEHFDPFEHDPTHPDARWSP